MAIRVLHYVGRMHRGGMETFIMNLYRNIDRQHVQFGFAVHGDEAGDYEKEILELGGEIFYFPHMRKNPIRYRKAWREFWAKNRNRYTAFHMHTNSLANVIAMEEAAKAGVPVRIIHSHSSMANKGRLQKLNDFLHKRHQKKLPRLATNLFACSDKAANWLFGGTTVQNLNVRQINNGISVEDFQFDPEAREALRSKLGLNGKKVIGHIGSFIPVKNHTFLMDVVEQAYRRDSSVRCVLIGGGPMVDGIRAKVREKALDDVVIFLGVCDNVNKLLSAIDIYVMPSLYEGLPVSLVEVQANGVPALVSDTITRDVKMQENLYYFPLSGSADQWAEQILSICDRGERVSDAGCITENGFDIIDTVKIYENIIMNRVSE